MAEAAPFPHPPPAAESSLEQLEELVKHLEAQREIALKMINHKKAMDQAKLLETERDTIRIVQDDTQETQFIYQHLPGNPPKNTVTVSNLQACASILDVEELLESCGEKLHYEVERGNRKALMIHVTFKNASGARKALKLKSPSIDGKPVMITRPQCAPNRLKPEDIKAPPNLDEALAKYREPIVQHKKKVNDVQVVSGGNCAETSATNKTARGGEIADKKQSTGLEDVSGIRAVKGGNMPEHSGTNAIKTAAKRGKKKKSNVSRVKNAGISAISTPTKGGRLPDKEQSNAATLRQIIGLTLTEEGRSSSAEARRESDAMGLMLERLSDREKIQSSAAELRQIIGLTLTEEGRSSSAEARRESYAMAQMLGRLSNLEHYGMP